MGAINRAVLSLCTIQIFMILKLSDGYQFMMEGAQRRCFTEDIPLSSKAIVTYTVLQGTGEAPMSMKAISHTGEVIHDRDYVSSGKFAIETPNHLPGLTKEESVDTKDDEDLEMKLIRNDPDGLGDNNLKYKFCFEQRVTGHHMPSLHAQKQPSRKVIFNVKYGSDAKTIEYYEQLAKEKHLTTAEAMFKTVEDQVYQVIHEIDEMRTRERRMDMLNRHTSSIVLWYCSSACVLVVAAAIFSSFATQSVLTKKNLLR